MDSKKGPVSFYNLGAVELGVQMHISRKDESRVTFVVNKAAVYLRGDSPIEAVYRGRFDKAEIRLVTCGGTFARVKNYLDNVVVIGHLAT